MYSLLTKLFLINSHWQGIYSMKVYVSGIIGHLRTFASYRNCDQRSDIKFITMVIQGGFKKKLQPLGISNGKFVLNGENG